MSMLQNIKIYQNGQVTLVFGRARFFVRKEGQDGHSVMPLILLFFQFQNSTSQNKVNIIQNFKILTALVNLEKKCFQK